ncbi:MAG: hypothetical protein Q8Q10_02175 [bacterium]|nr:hypothetical protein [bacterium]
MYSENPIERKEAANMGKETAEEMIARVEESLESGLFDRGEREEVKRMLRTAQLLTQNTETRKEIDRLLTTTENIYGGSA